MEEEGVRGPTSPLRDLTCCRPKRSQLIQPKRSFPHHFEITPLFWNPPTILRSPTILRYPHYFEIFIFGLLNLKFLRRLIYIVFERGARRTKCNFLVIFFKKKPKNAFLACFFLFKIMPRAHTVWPQQGLFIALGELGINLVNIYRV